MKQNIAIIIAGTSLACMLIYWGTPAALGWAVAFGGWTAWAFDRLLMDQDRGQS